MFGQAAAAAIQAKKDAEDADQGEAAENEEDRKELAILTQWRRNSHIHGKKFKL